jgi:hypothetical protein
VVAFREKSHFALLLIVLAPALVAIWAVPWFVTQDGPTHVYNAQILAWSFHSQSPFRPFYSVAWRPIPNWAGHLLLAGLVTLLPAWLADRIMTTATLIGFGAAILWLRRRVAPERDSRPAALLAALLAMNVTWLFGFASFLLGACLFPITLGIWWSGRDRLGAGRIFAIAALLALGYFCHLASVGLTMLGLVVLALAGPLGENSGNPWPRRVARLARTSVSFIPPVLLGLFYLRIARQAGQVHAIWRILVDPRSPAAWARQLAWVDPFTLAVKEGLPFSDRVGHAFILFAPVFWLAVAIIAWWSGRISSRVQDPSYLPAGGPLDHPTSSSGATVRGRDDRHAWLILAALLIIGGVVSPDSFGATHGEFLPQRLVLLGFVALVPVFDVDVRTQPGLITVGALTAAVVLQSARVWDYALYSDATAGQIIRAGDLVGRDQRVVTVLATTRSRFRANPLLHAEDWLGVDTGNIVWNNYETLHYYFPVQFQAGLKRPHAGDLELVSIREGLEEQGARYRDWQEILSRYADSIDVVLIWKRNERLEEITRRWFIGTYQRGDIQVLLRHRSKR